MPEALKVDFLSSLIKTKKLIQNKQPTSLDSPKAKSPEKAIVGKEHDHSIIMPLSSVSSLHALTEVVSLSDSHRETERYLERILSGVAAEGPFVQISLDVEGVGKTSTA
jgi:hypothetical protein